MRLRCSEDDKPRVPPLLEERKPCVPCSPPCIADMEGWWRVAQQQ